MSENGVIFKLRPCGNLGNPFQGPILMDVLGAGGQVGFVLLDKQGNGEGVPAEGVGVRKVSAHSHTGNANPDPVQVRDD